MQNQARAEHWAKVLEQFTKALLKSKDRHTRQVFATNEIRHGASRKALSLAHEMEQKG